MRYQELLLEFDVSKTTVRYGEQILKRCNDQRSATDMMMKIMRASYVEASRRGWTEELPDGRNNILEKYVGALDELQSELIVQEISNYDPSPNKQYTLWLILRYITKNPDTGAYGIQLWEDLKKATDLLAIFDAAKKHRYFRTPELAPFADINRFRSIQDLFKFVKDMPKEATYSMEARKESAIISNKGATVLLDSETCKVVRLLTQEGATFYGTGTNWCTTPKDGQFETYNAMGPIYVIVEKINNRRWQFHFESAQFMDESDDEVVNWEEIPREAMKLPQFYLPGMTSEVQLEIICNGYYDPNQIKETVAKLSPDELAFALFLLSEARVMNFTSNLDMTDLVSNALTPVCNPPSKITIGDNSFLTWRYWRDLFYWINQEDIFDQVFESIDQLVNYHQVLGGGKNSLDTIAEAISYLNKRYETFATVSINGHPIIMFIRKGGEIDLLHGKAVMLADTHELWSYLTGDLGLDISIEDLVTLVNVPKKNG
jgi:hypothetical protein